MCYTTLHPLPIYKNQVRQKKNYWRILLAKQSWLLNSASWQDCLQILVDSWEDSIVDTAGTVSSCFCFLEYGPARIRIIVGRPRQWTLNSKSGSRGHSRCAQRECSCRLKRATVKRVVGRNDRNAGGRPWRLDDIDSEADAPANLPQANSRKLASLAVAAREPTPNRTQVILIYPYISLYNLYITLCIHDLFASSLTCE